MTQTIPPPQAKLDIDGEETLSRMLMDLINTFPSMNGRKVCFSTLEQTSGIGFFPLSGAAVIKETKDITGTCYQTCQYPFVIIYRAAPKNEEARLRIKEFLDLLGKWLEKQAVPSANPTQIDAFLSPDGSRRIKTISRTSPAYLDKAYDDGIEEWCISINATYRNTFNIMR